MELGLSSPGKNAGRGRPAPLGNVILAYRSRYVKARRSVDICWWLLYICVAAGDACSLRTTPPKEDFSVYIQR